MQPGAHGAEADNASTGPPGGQPNEVTMARYPNEDEEMASSPSSTSSGENSVQSSDSTDSIVRSSSCPVQRRRVGSCNSSNRDMDTASCPSSADTKRPTLMLDWGHSGGESPVSSSCLPRQCPRRLWQADSEAQVCSMQLCKKTFSASFLPTFGSASNRRHHCRQCGRVVCSECSKGSRYMLPAENKAGLAKLVRVCNACLHGAETFNFRSNPSTQAAPQASNVKLLLRMSRSNSGSPKAVGRRFSGTSSEFLPHLRDLSLKESMSAPSLVALGKAAGADGNSPPNRNLPLSPRSPGSDTQEGLVGDSQRSCADTPKEVHRAQDQQVQGGSIIPIEPVIVDERVRQLEMELKASSYYQGLLKHEPAALRALTGALLANATVS